MTKKPKSQAELAQLGTMLTNIYESGYVDRNKAYKTSFLKGVVSGVGGVVGATIVIGLLLWVLSLFSSVPLVNRFTNSLQQTVNQRH